MPLKNDPRSGLAPSDPADLKDQDLPSEQGDTDMTAAIAELEKHLQEQARLAILNAINTVSTQGDIFILSALGIDGRQKMLDLFIRECQSLMEE